MNTTTQSPLDAAATAVNDAAVLMESIDADVRYWEGMGAQYAYGASRRQALSMARKCRESMAQAVLDYDAARAVLDAEIAKRPDLKVCLCGIPNCDGSL